MAGSRAYNVGLEVNVPIDSWWAVSPGVEGR